MPPAPRSMVARLMPFSAVLAGLLAMLIFFVCISRPMLADPDIWWHLHNARLLIQQHAFIVADSYTFTVAGKPWINPEWLSELPYYFAWRWFGDRGLEVVAIAMVEAVVFGVFWLCRQRVRNARAALLACVVFLPLISVSIGPRTLMFGWACLILELALLWEFRNGRDLLWWMPALFVLWINAHGSWPIGMVLLMVFVGSGLFKGQWGSIVAERWSLGQRKKLLLVAGLSLIALLVNPYGWHLVAYPFRITLGHKLTTATVMEWQTLNFHEFRGRFTFVFIAGLIVVNMVRRRMWLLHELLFTVIAILAAFTYTRLLILAGLVIWPLLAREFSFFADSAGTKERPILNLAIFAGLVAVVATHIPSQAELHQQIATANPEKALGYLMRADKRGRILNEFGWGGYLEWNAPGTEFFIDSRADVFDEWGVLQEYLDATNVRRTFEVMDKYKIGYVVFPKQEPIIYLLRHTPGWSTVYEDDLAVVMERAGSN